MFTFVADVEWVFLACYFLSALFVLPFSGRDIRVALTVLEFRKSVKSPILIGRCVSTEVIVVSTIHSSFNDLLSLRIGVISASRYLMKIRTALTVSRPSAANSFKVGFERSCQRLLYAASAVYMVDVDAYLLQSRVGKLACAVHAKRFGFRPKLPSQQ